MDSDDKLYAMIWVIVFLFALALTGTLLYSCEKNEDRRINCINAGHSTVECHDLFKWGN